MLCDANPSLAVQLEQERSREECLLREIAARAVAFFKLLFVSSRQSTPGNTCVLERRANTSNVQPGGILGCALVCPTSLYVRTIRFPTFCRSLPSVGAYSQYPAWSGCRRSADVPRADHDRVGSSPWQGGFKERVYCACLPSICLIFSTCKYAATAFNFKHKKTINVTDLS